MPQMLQETYTTSCKPARRAKQNRTTVGPAPVTKPPPAPSSLQRNILPLPASPMDGASDPFATPQPGPAKRGRKPGPLSRSARETQRKLNHSIIEKARRTKINDALATLRQLVPTDYGAQPKVRKDAEVDDGEDGDGGDDGEWNGGKNEKPKKSAKREEKEKEFKLEILVRTVSFMQDLIARVQVLEEGADPATSAVCTKCAQGAVLPSSKRRHDQFAEDGDCMQNEPVKRSRRGSPSSASIEPKDEAYQNQNQQISRQEFAARPYLGSRLPSISSWLPNQIDPVLLSPAQRRLSDAGITQLPSPPSSTQFDPIQTSHVPPVLSLGPVAISALLSPRRTPEDESAASLLLQISGSSPQVLPVTSSIPSITSFDMSKMRTACVTPVGHTRATRGSQTQAQTPGSMLGLVRRA
ncbi:hypothetical protein DXG03_009244 [Asterophora parasitica]|uniref:BHLH domain-containing protein n=1 Tax=Asterophora parasitica TaxID=117018 RepID=A0A9P7G6X2_9AGAR|nr:hypothetical protein DXG03_009244 [Asterophora parasitica]